MHINEISSSDNPTVILDLNPHDNCLPIIPKGQASIKINDGRLYFAGNCTCCKSLLAH